MDNQLSKKYCQKDSFEAFVWTSELSGDMFPNWFLDAIKTGIVNPELYGGDCFYIEINRPDKDGKYINNKFYVNPGDYICISPAGNIFALPPLTFEDLFASV